ncbi:uncharacterized protein LOC143184280 isoform X2 [Calliopsis andreniformis]|uniref:uncharacterized protein LOC143184280 isoform X2 n=1 Tax=Calliopsis andreniformis TaxID=337506 RepID=UPI003FCE2E77
MVICKYYRQGNCRYGQYCQFEHINNFRGNTKVETYNEDEDTAVTVAKEVLSAERGGQWLLSCFAPLKQRPCIPGMEDLSPEEVRWEMYQAQKNGMVEQAKLRFQQLCQDMKAKRDALKNPTRETIAMLKELQGKGQKGLPGNTTTSNVFGNKTYTMPVHQMNNQSIFGRPTTSSNPVFGGTSTFGSNLGNFGSPTSTSSIFGSTSNTSTFGTSGSIFGGGAAQSVFGQPSVFGTPNQVSNVFARPQTSQSTTSVFNNTGATSSPSLFSGSTSQSSPSIFGAAKTSTANLFVPAFGGAPIFGGGANFGATPGSIFGEQPTFGGSSNLFGGPNTTAPTFSSAAQSTNAFGATTVAPNVNIFGSTQGATPAISTSNASPFGTVTPTTSSPFATAASQFGATSSAASPFSAPAFGITTGAGGEAFGTNVTLSGTPFGAASTAINFGTATTTASPLFTTSTFGETKSSPFTSTITTATTTTTNPFAPRTQQTTSPFGNFMGKSAANTVTVSSSELFGKSPLSSIMTTAVIDDSIYSIQGQLTGDEESMYLAEKFTFGKIPLKPPTKELR